MQLIMVNIIQASIRNRKAFSEKACPLSTDLSTDMSPGYCFHTSLNVSLLITDEEH